VTAAPAPGELDAFAVASEGDVRADPLALSWTAIADSDRGDMANGGQDTNVQRASVRIAPPFLACRTVSPQ
jgi:hypothetical protein